MRRPKLMPDAAHPGMWRVRWPDGRVSDMTNLTRAKDAVACFMETEERRQRGRQSPSEGRPCGKTRDLGGKAPVKNAAEADASRVSPGFFAIDRGAFRCAAVGGLNVAVAHLVLARGTGPDNRTTQWSVHSIEQRTGISRPNAVKAVKDLLDRGIWKKMRGGQHPIYEAALGDAIPGGPFTIDEQAAIAALRNGNAVPYDSKTAIDALKARDIVRNHHTGRRNSSLELDAAAIVALTEPLAIWLPNALIDGAADEVPPIELIRQTRSLPALLLLVELYAVQLLPNFGGIPRELLKVVFDRAKIGEQGPFFVWGFRLQHRITANRVLARPFFTGQITSRDDGTRLDAGWDAAFWPAIHTLTDLGLVERVGMLFDGGDDEAEIIHPCAIRGGEPAERELATAAHMSGTNRKRGKNEEKETDST